TPEELARVIQPEDVAELVVFLARLNPRTCINEVLMSPTYDRFQA
ncbi:MAG: oxidoreductase, partial [Alphaproteobacteria bacterium]|nr:oxidoreductase [Alphaproteobacteria bacterium]